MALSNIPVDQNATLHTFRPVQNAVSCVVLGIVFLVGLPGNALVIWIILRHIKTKSPTIQLILHLAFADFIVLITLPLWIHSLVNGWVYGELFCKTATFLIFCSLYASLFFITLVSVKRLMAALYPFATHGFIGKAIISIWVSAFLIAIYSLIIQKLENRNGQLKCVTSYSSGQQQIVICLFKLLVGFVVPFTTLLVCYTIVFKRIKQMTFQTRGKSEKLIIGVVVTFVLCWSPYQITNIITISSLMIESSNSEFALTLKNIVETMDIVTGTLVFISSCSNPILYAFAARRFKAGFKILSFAKLFEYINRPSEELQNPGRDNAEENSGRETEERIDP
eukprot:gi/632944944/ref/XP_007887777.1/ PREDICTED: leukotriene B4 receptor 1-like [Callorhinchus milii]